MRTLPAVLAACLLLPGLALAAPAAPVAAPVAAKGAWFRYLLPQIPAGGFVTLANTGDTDATLTGVRSPACGMAMLHKTVSESGVDRMVHVKSVTIPAHGTMSFQPGGYHIMCMQPKMKTGETIDVTLVFAHAPPLTIPFTVYGATGRPDAK